MKYLLMASLTMIMSYASVSSAQAQDPAYEAQVTKELGGTDKAKNWALKFKGDERSQFSQCLEAKTAGCPDKLCSDQAIAQCNDQLFHSLSQINQKCVDETGLRTEVLKSLSTDKFMVCANNELHEAYMATKAAHARAAKQAANLPGPTARPANAGDDDDIQNVVVTASRFATQNPAGAAAPAASATCPDEVKIDQLADQCSTQTDSASSSCNSDADPGLTSASSLGNNLAAGLQGVAATSGTCSQVGNYGTALNGAMASYNQSCSSSYTQCQQACSALSTYLATSSCTGPPKDHAMQVFESKNQVCGHMNTKSGLVQQQGNASLAGIAQATNCANQASAMAAIPTVAACAANPAAPGCEAVSSDCSNPTVAASNPVCVCGANPSSASCKALSQTATASGTVGALSGSGGAAMSGGTSGSTAIDIGNAAPDTTIPKELAALAGGSSGGSGGAGNGAIGGGLVGTATPDAKRGSGSKYSADILGGTRGSSAVNGFVGGRGGASSGAQVYQGNYNKDPDLRKFLPGGQLDPKRGIAGATGADGITGPYGDIFQKVTTRYNVVAPTLLP